MNEITDIDQEEEGIICNTRYRNDVMSGRSRFMIQCGPSAVI